MIRLFHGKNQFLTRTLAAAAVAHVQKDLEHRNIPFETRTFDASSSPADTIIAEIETPSLFSRHKVIIVKRPSENSAKDFLYTCIGGLLPLENQSVDIILWENSRLAANLKIVKLFQKYHAIEESPELNRRAFKSWAQKHLSQSGLSLSSDAVYLLAERVNYDPERLSEETNKLSLLGKKTIDEADIELLCPDTLEHTIWELIDAMNTNNTSLAEKKLDRVLRQGNDPLYVLLMIARNMRIILLTKLMLQEGASAYDIARKIRIPPFTIHTITSKARTIDFDRICMIYDKLSNIDYAGKTGQLDIPLALNILLSVI